MSDTAQSEETGHEEAASSDVASHSETVLHEEVGHATDEHGGGGLPQMDVSTYPSQLFWLTLTFLFLYVMMSRIVLPRIGQVIEERRDRIAADLDRAAELKEQSEAALSEYETALAEARAKAQKLAQETRERLAEEADAEKTALEAELAKKLDAAESKIAETKEKALASIRDVANDTAKAVVSRILGEDVDGPVVSAAVDAELQNRSG